MATQKIIVIGTSAGGVKALKTLVSGLPKDIQAPICIVQHIGRNPSYLPALLGRAGPLPAIHPYNGMMLLKGHIYIAPPDYHLLIADDHLHLSRGPRENFARPAIDPLFRSAAAAYGPDAIGVILTGKLNDGTAGLYELKQHGGVAIIQSLRDADYEDMPRSALAHVETDYCVSVADVPPLLSRLAAGPARPYPTQAFKEAIQMGKDYLLERPVALGCPDCGGAVRRSQLGTLTQYRCHIGHAYTAQALAEAQFRYMETRLETALRTINERAEVCRQMAEQPDLDDPEARDAWYAAMREAEERAAALGELLSAGWLAPECQFPPQQEEPHQFRLRKP